MSYMITGHTYAATGETPASWVVGYRDTLEEAQALVAEEKERQKDEKGAVSSWAPYFKIAMVLE